MIVRGLAILLAFLGLAGCQQESDHGGGWKGPPELKQLNDFAFACWQDSYLVPVQNSEHCVILAESYLDGFRDECHRSRSYECLEYNLAYSDIYSLYQLAIISSSIKFGIPDEILNAAPETDQRRVYYDGEFLRTLFENCLRKEEEALAKNGLRRVHRLPPNFLAEDQMCIREGNGRFETAPL